MATKAVAKKTSSALVTTDFSQEMEDLRARLTAPTGNRIKMDNKTFKFPNGDVADSVDAVIVDFVYMNKYYEGAYDPNNIVPLNCFAMSPLPNSLEPSPNAPDIQSQTGCASCAQNQFGTNGKGKACQNRVLIALLIRPHRMQRARHNRTHADLFALEVCATQALGFDCLSPARSRESLGKGAAHTFRYSVGDVIACRRVNFVHQRVKALGCLFCACGTVDGL